MELAWQFARGSSNAMEEGFGSNQNKETERHLNLACRHKNKRGQMTIGTNQEKKNKPEVLLVDDNPADSDLTSEALSRCSCAHEVRAVQDGIQAIEFLRRRGKYASVRPPDLVILDLNLPGKDGRAVLAEVKTDPVLKCTPIVIFSTSQAKSDIKSTLELGANSYVSKPGNLQDFMSTVTSICEYWFKYAVLPTRKKP
jgi:CheY-like chemotaxis protein